MIIRNKVIRKLLRILLYVPVKIILLVRSLIYIRNKSKYKAKAANIIEGFTNLAVPDPKIEALANLRASICGECPEAVSIGLVNRIDKNNQTSQINGMQCRKCGCLLNAKVRSTKDYCPLGKW
jgi:hypothetical protein